MLMTFKQFIGGTTGTLLLHDDANLMTLRAFIDALELLDAQKSDEERLVEIREDVPEPGALAIRLWVRDQEEEEEQ